MTYPPLPEPTVIDGRRLYTAGDMRAYGDACVNACREADIGVRVVYDSIATHHPPKSHIKNATTSSTTQNCSMATANALGVI